jgi:hypothetical protein
MYDYSETIMRYTSLGLRQTFIEEMRARNPAQLEKMTEAQFEEKLLEWYKVDAEHRYVHPGALRAQELEVMAAKFERNTTDIKRREALAVEIKELELIPERNRAQEEKLQRLRRRMTTEFLPSEVRLLKEYEKLAVALEDQRKRVVTPEVFREILGIEDESVSWSDLIQFAKDRKDEIYRTMPREMRTSIREVMGDIEDLNMYTPPSEVKFTKPLKLFDTAEEWAAHEKNHPEPGHAQDIAHKLNEIQPAHADMGDIQAGLNFIQRMRQHIVDLLRRDPETGEFFENEGTQDREITDADRSIWERLLTMQRLKATTDFRKMFRKALEDASPLFRNVIKYDIEQRLALMLGRTIPTPYEAEPARVSELRTKFVEPAKVEEPDTDAPSFEEIWNQVRRGVAPRNTQINTWSEMKALVLEEHKARPTSRTMKMVKLVRRRENIDEGKAVDALSTYPESQLMGVNATLMGIKPGELHGLKERLAAIKRSHARAENNFPLYRDTLLNQLEKYRAGFEFPKDGVFRRVRVAKDANDTAAAAATRAIHRRLEGLPGIKGTVGTFNDDTQVVPKVKVETLQDLLHVLDSFESNLLIREEIAYERQQPRNTYQAFGPKGERVTAEVRAKVRTFIANMVGDVRVEFKDFPSKAKHVGEFNPEDSVIYIANTINTDWILSNSAHEAMHAVFALAASQREKRLLSRVFANDAIVDKILDRLKAQGMPAEQLKDIKDAITITDRKSAIQKGQAIEERMAYAFQVFVQDHKEGLPAVWLPAAPRNVFQRILFRLKQIFRYTTEHEQVTNLFEGIVDGRHKEATLMDAELDIRNAGGWKMPRSFDKAIDAATEWLHNMSRGFITPIDVGLRQTRIPALVDFADLIFRSPIYDKQSENRPTFLNRFQRRRIREISEFHKVWDTMSERRRKRLHRNVYEGRLPDSITDAKERQDMDWFHIMLIKYHRDMQGVGLRVGQRAQLQPQVWDGNRIAEKEQDLRKLIAQIMKENEKSRAPIIEKVGGVDQMIALLKGEAFIDPDIATPTAQQTALTYKFFDGYNIQKFMEPDLEVLMHKHITETMRNIEYAKTFGPKGEVATALLNVAVKQGATAREIEDAKNYLMAIQGKLGQNMSLKWRKASAWIMTYQHLRLLSMAVLSSLVEAMGPLVRSNGDLHAAFEGWKTAWQDVQNLYTNGKELKGLKSRIAALRKIDHPTPEQEMELETLVRRRQEIRTEATAFAEEMGTLDGAVMYDDAISFTSPSELSPVAAKVNKWFFRTIGLTQWTELSRKMATRTAYVFIRENGLNPRAHSERFLRELNLEPSELMFQDGELLYNAESMLAADANMTVAEAERRAEKIKDAVWQFVDESTLRPNSATAPIKGSDPHWALLFHMKKYIWTIQTQIVNRVVKELAVHRNPLPLIGLTTYIPVMFMADFMRTSIQYAFADEEEDETRNPFNRYSFGELMWRETMRSGALGIAEPVLGFGQSTGRISTSIFGPTAEHGTEWARSFITGSPDISSALERSLPFQNAYSRWGNN